MYIERVAEVETKMSHTSITLEDRQAIYDTLARYVWCMDTGNLEGVVAAFTDHGVIKDITGKLWDARAGGVRGFVAHFLMRPNRDLQRRAGSLSQPDPDPVARRRVFFVPGRPP